MMFFRILEVMLNSSAGIFLPGAKHFRPSQIACVESSPAGRRCTYFMDNRQKFLEPYHQRSNGEAKARSGTADDPHVESFNDRPALSKGGRVRRPEPPRDLAFLAWSLRPYVHCSRRSLLRSGTGGTCVPLGWDRGEYLVQAFACTQPPG